MKRCSKCKKTRDESEFNKYVGANDGLFPQCTFCTKEQGRKYYKNNKEAVKQRCKTWSINNRGRKTESEKDRRNRLKLEIIKAYGSKCSCCGENMAEFLTLEHINGDAQEHKRQIMKERGLKSLKSVRCDLLWSDVKRLGFPDNYTILCMNCNFAKGMFGYCPHDREHN